MNSLLGTFSLKDFDIFFNNYKSKNILASEAITALDHFLLMLNKFFDLCEDLTNTKNAIINWYSYANIANEDYINAKSMYYNELLFSDILINMNEQEFEDYNTYYHAYFGRYVFLFYRNLH